MKTQFIIFLLLISAVTAYSHSDTRVNYQYGQVIVSIRTGNYNRVQEDVKLMGQILNEVCKELKIKDTVLVDFIHDSGCINCESSLIFSKTEPFRYFIEYLGNDSLKLVREKHTDSLKESAIESTIRIIGSKLDIRQDVFKAVQYLYFQNQFDSTEFGDLQGFNSRVIHKSAMMGMPHWIVKRKENKILNKVIGRVLSEPHWLYNPRDDSQFLYYYQDSVYNIVAKQDSALIYSTKSIYCLTEGNGARPIYSRQDFFVFTTPFDFTIIDYYRGGYKDGQYSNNLVILKQSHYSIPNIREYDIGLNGNWKVSWIFGDVYLFDHSYFLVGTEGPFVLFDTEKKEFIHTQIR